MSQDEKEHVAKDSLEEKSFLKEYKSVLNSKASEENLVSSFKAFYSNLYGTNLGINIFIRLVLQLNFARWEPFHGRFKPCHPWNLYLEVGTQTRQVAYQIDALNCHLSEGNINVMRSFLILKTAFFV